MMLGEELAFWRKLDGDDIDPPRPFVRIPREVGENRSPDLVYFGGGDGFQGRGALAGATGTDFDKNPNSMILADEIDLTDFPNTNILRQHLIAFAGEQGRGEGFTFGTGFLAGGRHESVG